MGNQETALATFKHQAPVAFGSNDEIEGLIERMEKLLPVKLDESAGALIKSNLRTGYVRAAQLCAFYSLVPGTDVHLIQFGQDFVVDMGIETWKKAADRYCALQRITYSVAFKEMPLEMVRARRGDLYDPEDCGSICYLWRSDKQPFYELMAKLGMAPDEYLTVGHGIWAKKAKERKDRQGGTYWLADTIPTQRTKFDVARRRAQKAALKQVFSLDSLLAPTPKGVAENVEWLNRMAEMQEQRSSISQRKPVHLDQNGFIVDEPVDWAEEDEPPMPEMSEDQEDIVEGTYTHAPSHTDKGHSQDADFGMGAGTRKEPVQAGFFAAQPQPETDEAEDAATEEDAPAERDHIDYNALAGKLSGESAKLVEWARKNHAIGEPAAIWQYRMLAGAVDKLVGKGNHNLVLGTLIGRAVHSQNPPSAKLVSLLLSFLQPKVDELDANNKPVLNEKGKKRKVDNPHYKQNIADTVVAIWHTISAI